MRALWSASSCTSRNIVFPALTRLKSHYRAHLSEVKKPRLATPRFDTKRITAEIRPRRPILCGILSFSPHVTVSTSPVVSSCFMSRSLWPSDERVLDAVAANIGPSCPRYSRRLPEQAALVETAPCKSQAKRPNDPGKTEKARLALEPIARDPHQWPEARKDLRGENASAPRSIAQLRLRTMPSVCRDVECLPPSRLPPASPVVAFLESRQWPGDPKLA